MPMTRLLTTALLLALASGAGAQDKGKKLYCWEENGRKVCGDALPAEAAGSGRTEFNAKSGMKSGEVARALTEEERAAAAAVEAEAARLAEAETARTRRELAMVESYTTEADLRRAFQERVDLLDETVKASRLGVGNLRQSLLGLLRQAGEMELAGKPVPANVAANVANQHRELRRQQSILISQQRELAALGGEFDAAVARYRELKQVGTATAPAAAPVTPPSG
jgi:hypothetical protein